MSTQASKADKKTDEKTKNAAPQPTTPAENPDWGTPREAVSYVRRPYAQFENVGDKIQGRLCKQEIVQVTEPFTVYVLEATVPTKAIETDPETKAKKVITVPVGGEFTIRASPSIEIKVEKYLNDPEQDHHVLIEYEGKKPHPKTPGWTMHTHKVLVFPKTFRPKKYSIATAETYGDRMEFPPKASS